MNPISQLLGRCLLSEWSLATNGEMARAPFSCLSGLENTDILQKRRRGQGEKRQEKEKEGPAQINSKALVEPQTL